MREKGTGSRARERAENVKPDPKNKNTLGKLSGRAFIILLSNWISEQFPVAFVPDELKRSPSTQAQDRQD